MSKNVALTVAGLIFTLAALAHLARLFTHFQVILGTHVIPISSSGVGLVVAAVLAIWMFAALKGK